MTNLLIVREAVKNRLESVLGVNGYTSMPTYPEVPAVVVTADFPVADFEQGFNSLTTLWRLQLTIMIDPIDEEAGQAQLAEWMDPSGPFIRTLRLDAEDIDDALSALTSDIRVSTGGDIDNEMTLNHTKFLYGQIRIQVKA